MLAHPPSPRYHLRDRTTISPLARYRFVGLCHVHEQDSYQKVTTIPEWQTTIFEELATMEHDSTWDIIPCPSHAVPITCKWVFKVKTRSDRTVERYKACLVVHDFQQECG